MTRIKVASAEAYKYLMKESPERWSRHAFKHSLKSDDNTNNFVESFNAVIVKHRKKPCLAMLESIRSLIGVRFKIRNQQADKWGDVVTPYVRKKLEGLYVEARQVYDIIAHEKEVFETKEGATMFVVQLEKRECDCQRWQITGIPCKHVVAIVSKDDLEIEDYIDDFYSVHRYKGLYNNIVMSVSHHDHWPDSDLPELDPPAAKMKLGRPELHARRVGHDTKLAKAVATARKEGDVQRVHDVKSCKKCGKLGHNIKTCDRPRDDYGYLLHPTPRIRKQPESSTSTSVPAPEAQNGGNQVQKCARKSHHKKKNNKKD